MKLHKLSREVSTFIILCFTLFMANNTLAQDRQLAGVTSVVYPGARFKDTDQNAKLSFQEYGGFIKFPYIFKKDSSILINGLGYGRVDVSGTGSTKNGLFEYNERLKVFYYQLAYFRRFRNNWRALVSLKPTVASDFNSNLSTDDFILQGIAFATKKWREDFSMGLGFVYTFRFGKPLFIPVLPLRYKNGKHQVRGILPIQFIYNYAIDKKERFNIGFKETANGAQFNLKVPVTNDFATPEMDKVAYSRINIGAFINYHLTPFLLLEVYGGTSLRRKYMLIDVNNISYDYELKENPFLQFTIALVPPQKIKK